jgi:hypothetical protein
MDLAPAGIGVDLRAVERHRTQLEHPYLARQCQHLHEQPFDLLEKAPPKRRDRVVIGMVVCRDEAERHRIVRRTLQLPAGKHACGVAVNSGHSSMTMRDGLPGIASKEAESKVRLLGNAHRLSRTDLGDLALARGLRLRLLF